MSSPNQDLSLRELEELLAQRRRRRTEDKVKGFVAAEGISPKPIGPVGSGTTRISEPKSPDSWRDPRGNEPYFRSLTITRVQTADRPSSAMVTEGRHARRPTWRSVGLLVLEFVALAGFLAIVVVSYGRLRALNRDADELQASQLQLGQVERQPAPTPSLRPAVAVMPTKGIAMSPVSEAAGTPLRVLPGERPLLVSPATIESQGLVESDSGSARLPTPGGSDDAPGTAIRLAIPSIEVDAPVVQGDTWDDLKRGAGQHPGSAGAGQRGNLVISAHNDIYGEIFRDLDKLEVGDEVLVYTTQRLYRYIVRQTKIVPPSRIEVMEPTDYPALTLITCYPYLLDTHRVVVVAELAE